jgi:hypothetical protein
VGPTPGSVGPSPRRATQDRRLKVSVRTSFEESEHRYGSPRIFRDLLEPDVGVSRKRAIRLMQEESLKGRIRKRFKCTTMSDHEHGFLRPARSRKDRFRKETNQPNYPVHEIGSYPSALRGLDPRQAPPNGPGIYRSVGECGPMTPQAIPA